MSESVPVPGAPPKRRIRNYLLDPAFQLKYAGIIVVIALALTSVLGFVIMRTANKAASEAQSALIQAERAMHESQTTSSVIMMGQLQRNNDPDLVATIRSQLADADRQAQHNVDEVRAERGHIESNRRITLDTLIVASGLLVFILGALGIVITHKVVGPVFKMKRLLRKVGSGKLDIQERLRKGDELEDLFAAFLEMVEALRKAQQHELSRLEATLETIEKANRPEDAISDLKSLARDMRAALGRTAA